MDTSAGITVRHLTCSFAHGDSRLIALQGLTLDVPSGAFMSVIGPSGGGKTTLLRAIGGLITPDSGSIAVQGVSSLEAQRRNFIGFVFQDPSLLPWRTVLQNVRLAAELGSASARARGLGPSEVVDMVGLSEFAHRYPHELSGGMRQRVALGRALAVDPPVLLMDEPFGALDEITRQQMQQELLGLWESSQRTVLFITHSISEAIILSDRIAVLSSRPGRVVREFDVRLPRPRPDGIERSPEFLDYAAEIKRALSAGATVGRTSS
jgi:NitT/TauT family transport system ATP-binding protein